MFEPAADGEGGLGPVVTQHELVEILGISLGLEVVLGLRGGPVLNCLTGGDVEIRSGRRIRQEPDGKHDGQRAQTPAGEILHGAIRFPRR